RAALGETAQGTPERPRDRRVPFPAAEGASSTRAKRTARRHVDAKRDYAEASDAGEIDEPGTLDGTVEVCGVSFGYNRNAPPLLIDINLSLKPGRCAALVGPMGGGKSTLVKLIAGQ